MCPATDNPARRKIRAIVLRLHARNMSAVEIHRELCAVKSKDKAIPVTGRGGP
jgi:hypothetical protein